jgi:hypothetical protein
MQHSARQGNVVIRPKRRFLASPRNDGFAFFAEQVFDPEPAAYCGEPA